MSLLATTKADFAFLIPLFADPWPLCRVVHSRDVHRCYLVPRCPVSCCQVSRFQRPPTFWYWEVRFNSELQLHLKYYYTAPSSSSTVGSDTIKCKHCGPTFSQSSAQCIAYTHDNSNWRKTFSLSSLRLSMLTKGRTKSAHGETHWNEKLLLTHL